MKSINDLLDSIRKTSSSSCIATTSILPETAQCKVCNWGSLLLQRVNLRIRLNDDDGLGNRSIQKQRDTVSLAPEGESAIWQVCSS